MAQKTTIILTGYIDVPMEHRDAVVLALPAHIELSRAEPGCLYFNVEEDPNQIGRFHVSERFSSQEDFDAHQIRMKSSPWAKITIDIERFYSIEKLST